MRRDVRYGSKADIGEVRLMSALPPKSGHCLSVSGCPLCAKSGHWPRPLTPDWAFNSAATAAAEPSLYPAENWRAAHGTARQLTYVKPHYRFAPWATRRVIGSEAVVANC